MANPKDGRQTQITSFMQRGDDFVFCYNNSPKRKRSLSLEKHDSGIDIVPNKKPKPLIPRRASHVEIHVQTPPSVPDEEDDDSANSSESEIVLGSPIHSSDDVNELSVLPDKPPRKNSVRQPGQQIPQQRHLPLTAKFQSATNDRKLEKSVAGTISGDSDSDVVRPTRSPPATSGRFRQRTNVSYAVDPIEPDSDEEEDAVPARKQKRHPDDSDDEYQGDKRGETTETDAEDELDDDRSVVSVDAEITEDDTGVRKANAFEKLKKQRQTNTQSSERRALDLNLPPLSSIPEIFEDITRKALSLGLREVIQHQPGRPLRVATMCSGTESPLLALSLVNRSLQKLGECGISIDHKFSAEIEPFKQAWIERQVKPPLLFRDVTEFNEGERPEGTTAYGSRHLVPCDVDILAAGSSCVDFSLLNNNPNSQGESKDTFKAVIAVVRHARIPIVIIENVIKDEAWTHFQTEFRKIGYATQIAKVDSKDYYLPHTRQRKYMLALDKKRYSNSVTKYLRQWGELMDTFRRRASSPITSFLLPPDDTRYLRMAAGSVKELIPKDWLACRRRHEDERRKQKLGSKRPVTTVLPDHSDRKWLQHRPERDQELLDIVHLRHAVHGVDSLYKTRPIDLSQNVDRIDRANWGITGCLTPKGSPFLTDQCRRLTGHEVLTLQGIDIDSVTFTSETDANLRDLAGNAMTSTVVGPAILSALIVGHKGFESYEYDATEVPSSATLSKTSRLCGADQLSRDLTQQANQTTSWSRMLDDAMKSQPYCLCEGRSEISRHPILICKDCQYTACQHCAGNPQHSYEEGPILRSARLHPSEFHTRWRNKIPRQLRLSNLPDFSQLAGDIDRDIKAGYIDAVTSTTDEDFALQDLLRLRHWEINFRSPKYRLKLTLGPEPTWQLFACPDPLLSANSKLRHILQQPIARHPVPDPQIKDLFNLEGGWQWYIPCRQTATIEIAQSVDKSPSWRSRIGLEKFESEMYSNRLDIKILARDDSVFRGLQGRYELRQDCGTACQSLYRRVQHDPLFFFLDPNPIGEVTNDNFVFSVNPNRLAPGECRPIIASVRSGWRAWSEDRKSTCTIISEGFWTKPSSTTLAKVHGSTVYTIPNVAKYDELRDIQACNDASTLISTSAIIPQQMASKWSGTQFIKGNDSAFFRDYAWVLAGIPGLDTLQTWRPLPASISDIACSSCSPKPPAIKWLMDANKAVILEDHLAAAEYERRMKDRPPEFVVQATSLPGNIMHIQIGISLKSLIHRAASQLPSVDQLAWNLDPFYFERTFCHFPRFRLRTNQNETRHADLTKFKLPLRPDQLRSLTWMKQQERGVPFNLEEIEEAVLPALNWKAEVRASSEVMVRGGVLADEPSYGKTITSLALINEDFVAMPPEDIVKNFAQPDTGLINTAATLIVTPNHLADQWYEELGRFCGGFRAKEVLVIRKVAVLRDLTAKQLCQAKVVIVPWTILTHETYANQLAIYAAYPQASSTKGREFRCWQEHAIPELPKHTKMLQRSGIQAFKASMVDKLESRIEDPDFAGIVPSKRLKGAKYAAVGKQKVTQSSSSYKAAGAIASRGDDNWRSLDFPVLHMFRWNRLLVDEFSYLLSKEDGSGNLSYRDYSPAFASVVGLQAEKRWVLSGTPPLRDFFDVKRIALFLDINLGIDSFAPEALNADNFSNLREQLSSSEKFRAYQESRSHSWHEHRHNRAQAFLNQFARQNAADVNSIDCIQSIVTAKLNFDHAVVHEELYSHLSINELDTSNKTKHDGDEGSRINSLLNSKSAGHALLHSCAVVREKRPQKRQALRNEELDELRSQLADDIALLRLLKQKRKSENDVAKYDQFKAQTFGDAEVHSVIRDMFSSHQPRTSAQSTQNKTLRKQLDDALASVDAYTARLRAVRRYTNLLALQSGDKQCDNSRCDSTKSQTSLRLLTACGHVVCTACLSTRSHLERCPVPGCTADVLDEHMRRAEYYGDHQCKRRRFGAKLGAIVRLIESLPSSEQALLFVQSPELVDEVRECLEHYDITCTASDGIYDFQHTRGADSRRVLILSLAGEEASGLNLTNVNHIIFLSPLLSSTQYDYEATMKQAIRRVRRTGQKKSVFVYRFVALNTIDVDILERRERLLTEPIWSEGHLDQKSLPEPSREAKGTPEPSRLVRDSQGDFALVPLSQVDERFEDEDFSSNFPFQDIGDDEDSGGGVDS